MTTMEKIQFHVPPGSVPVNYPFWLGGSASSMAVFLTHPLELVKTRMQVVKGSGPRQGPIQMVSHITKTEGPIGLYRGLSAGVTRTLMYGTTRFGLYEVFKTYRQNTTQQAPAISTLIPIAALSGFIGGIVGNPADLANVRMQSDFGLPVSSRRNYKSVFDAWIRMGREEGWQCFTRALWPNAVRAALMTASQLASYDGFKTVLTQHLAMADGAPTQFIASALASLVATTACSPVDVIKTRMMSSRTSLSIVSLIFEITRTEGLAWVFRGWVPSFVRLGPQTIATLLLLEQHKRIFRLFLV